MDFQAKITQMVGGSYLWNTLTQLVILHKMDKLANPAFVYSGRREWRGLFLKTFSHLGLWLVYFN